MVTPGEIFIVDSFSGDFMCASGLPGLSKILKEFPERKLSVYATLQ